MAEPITGLFEQFGLSGLTEEEIISERRRAQDTAEIERLREDPRRADLAGARRGGQIIGNALRKKFGKGTFIGDTLRAADPTITERERSNIDLTGAVRDRMTDLQRTPDFVDADSLKKQRMMQKVLAEEAFKAGRPDVGVPALRKFNQETLATEKQEAELAKLRAQGRSEAADATTAEAEAGVAGRVAGARARAVEAGATAAEQKTFDRNSVQTIWAEGIGVGDQGANAFIDRDGNAITQNEAGEEVIFAPGQYTSHAPASLSRSGRRQRTLAQEMRDVITPKQADTIRQQGMANLQQLRASNNVLEIIDTTLQENDGELNILDGSGSAIAFTRKVMDSVNALSREFGGTIKPLITTASGKTRRVAGAPGTQAWAESLLDATNTDDEELKSYFPEGAFRASSRGAAQMRAQVVALAYAKARANEPGAKQLSDTDFKNALAEIGASSSDPELMRRIFRQNSLGAMDDFEFRMNSIEERFHPLLLQPKARARLDEEFEKFKSMTSEDFGTASDPNIPETDRTIAAERPEQLVPTGPSQEAIDDANAILEGL